MHSSSCQVSVSINVKAAGIRVESLCIKWQSVGLEAEPQSLEFIGV